MKTLIVVLVGNKPKGIFTESQFDNYSGKKWWDSKQTVEVPQQDWDAEKINIGNIEKYL